MYRSSMFAGPEATPNVCAQSSNITQEKFCLSPRATNGLTCKRKCVLKPGTLLLLHLCLKCLGPADQRPRLSLLWSIALLSVRHTRHQLLQLVGLLGADQKLHLMMCFRPR
jgi:hypothetical protein